ncbi:hypothetical protein CJF25_04790 [Photobacterium phosphoreum]|uniref:hypothetical protein n=1 Tax=Photobacterium phosphoreum TaxID=659 RepID=UPI001E340210|nr:hypothetical protein [Photobacterium phosphoreum]MCD9462312.1 hypothetical protein [Photobacterium phosphoreum]
MSRIEVFDIPEDRKYWVVRAGKNAAFFNHFKSNSVIAIGHADGIEFNDIEGMLSYEQKIYIKEQHYSLLTSRGESSNQIGNKNSQVNRFLQSISINDVIITVTSKSIMAGRVTSDAYESEVPIGCQVSAEDYSECNFRLRRNVIWSRRYPRDKLPFELETVLRNHSAVFQIGEEKKVDILNHWLAPIYLKEDSICMSTRIEQEESISNRTITRYSSLLDELELVAEYLSTTGEEASVEGYETYKNDNRNSYEYQLTTQQSFMSPGDNFIRLRASQSIKLKYYAMAFALLFGCSAVFAEEGHDLNEAQNLQHILSSIIVQVSDSHDFPDIASRLNLRLPLQNADVLRSYSEPQRERTVAVQTDQAFGNDEFPTNNVSGDTPL